MFKKILIASVFLFPGFIFAKSDVSTETPATSIDKNSTDSNMIWNNWFISVGAGAQILDNEEIIPTSSNNHLATNLDSTFTFLVPPNTGVRTMSSGLSLKGRYREGTPSNEHYNDGINGIYAQHNKLNLHADILFFASNLICSYNEKRIWNVIPSSNYLKNNRDKAKHTSEIGHATDFSYLKQDRTYPIVNIKLDINGTFQGNNSYGKQMSVPYGNFKATLGFHYNYDTNAWKNYQIHIDDESRWSEHCTHMIYLNENN